MSADPGKKFLLYMLDDDGNELKYLVCNEYRNFIKEKPKNNEYK